MVVAMNEFYCCYDPRRNEDTTPERTAYEENVASPALDKILIESIKEIGKNRFERFAERLNQATKEGKFKAFSKT